MRYAQQLFPTQMRWELNHDYAMQTTLWFWRPALNLTNGWFDPISSRLTRWLRAQARKICAVSSSLPISCRASRWEINASCKCFNASSKVSPKTAMGRSVASPFHTSSSRQRRAKTGISSTLEALLSLLFSPKILSSTDTRWKPSVFVGCLQCKKGENLIAKEFCLKVLRLSTRLTENAQNRSITGGRALYALLCCFNKFFIFKVFRGKQSLEGVP